MLRCKVSRSPAAMLDAGQFAEPGVDAVDGLALGDDPIDGLGAAADRGPAAGIDRHGGAAVDGLPLRQADLARSQQNGRHCPLQTRACSGLNPMR